MSDTATAEAKKPRPQLEKKSVTALARAMFRARTSAEEGASAVWKETKKEEVKMARKALRRLSAQGFELVKKDA